MAGFLYYVPGDHQQTHESLAAIGFPHADIAGTPGCGCTAGPDGVAGYVFEASFPCVEGAKGARVGYYPDKQTWHQCDGWWLGWETDNAPRPIDVQRMDTLGQGTPAFAGYPCAFADGSTWIVPVVRKHTGFPALPTVFGGDPNGDISFKKVETQYEPLWKLAEELMAILAGETENTQTNAQAIDLIVLAMALNYHVTRWELLYRGLIGTSVMSDIFAAILDIPAMAAAVAAIGGVRG